jgi:4-hydroxy-4-methyl-2-oxoglutarate aldolase
MIHEPPRLTIRTGFARPTSAQIRAFRDVPTGFICDAMQGRGALATEIAPLSPNLPAHAVGTALVADNGPEEILATMGALHVMQAGDFIVSAVRGCTQCSAAGDQFMGMLNNKGAAGFVTDGAMRDLEGIEEVGLPAWCAGLNPNSPFSNGPGYVGFGAVVGGQMVNSGDILVGDSNGVVVVPHAQIDAVIAALEAVKEAEITLEAKVKAGGADMPAIAQMLADGTAVMVD